MTVSGSSADRQVLHGHVPPAIKKLSPVGRLEATKRLKLAISLPPRNQAALTRLLQDLYNPQSPQFRQYLTPAQFAERFGPSQEDYQALAEFARANGFKVTKQHGNRVILSVEAAVADIERAFHVTMRTYQHPKEARTFYAPDADPSVDSPLPLLHVGGLNSFSLPKPAVGTRRPGGAANAKSAPHAGSGAGPGGSYAGNDIRNAYIPGATLTGAGQTITLLEYDAYYPSDIAAYVNASYGVTSVPPLVNIDVDGGVPTPGDWDIEVSLDIEMVMSMAPGISTIYVYESPWSAPWEDILSQIANDNKSRQVSCSWYGGNINPDPAAEVIFQQMAAQGQSFFTCTADYDAYTGGAPFPADSPNVTAVGGTTLSTSGPGGSWLGETAWNFHDGTGTCGGISTVYSIPSWQKGVSMAFNQGSNTMRNVPDVAMTASNMYITYGNGATTTGGWGTSFATPLWASFTALVNQQAAAHGNPPVGFLNPTLYNIGKSASFTTCFRDTVTGDNTNAESPTQFFAAAGYDLCTGWGSPTTALISTLAGPVPTILSFTPASALPGASVTILGTNFQGVTSVVFNGVQASFTVNSSTQITATVPAGAASGAITVTTAGGVATSADSFGVFQFSPAYGLPGTLVIFTSGGGFSQASTVSFNGTPASFAVVLDTQMTATIPAGATTGAVTITAPSQTISSAIPFVVLTGDGAPTISSFTPNGAAPGSSVTILGSNFAGVTGVSIGGVSIPAADITVISQTQIVAVVPMPAATANTLPAGVIVVTTSRGTATSADTFATHSFAATFDSASSVPLTAHGFTAGGWTVYSTLNFAPTPGTNLTLINNTDISFINGWFTNLVQGQWVTLSYRGSTYDFIVDYYGGTGNDLVLRWAHNRPVSWGYNQFGQLGNSVTYPAATPVATVGTPLAGKTVTAVAAGRNHSLALCSDGTLAAWGENQNGQLGNGSNDPSPVPVAVTTAGTPLAGKTVVAIAAGWYFSMALCSDGTLATWGENINGQLGNGSTTDSNLPLAVTIAGTPLAGKTVTTLAAGSRHVLAVCADGTLAAWGLNSNGQLGNGNTTNKKIPTAVTITGTPLAGTTPTVLAASGNFSLALCANGTLVAWGENDKGQLGNNSIIDSSVALAVTTSGTPLAGKIITSIAAGNDGHCLASCLDGTITAWGFNNHGQLGLNNKADRKTPRAVITSGVLSGKTVKAVAAGDSFSVALCTDGTVAAWGENGNGQMGNNSTTDSSVPVTVTATGTALAGKAVTSLAVGFMHNLVLCSDGGLAAWGDNSDGELGITFPAPAPVVTSGTALDGETIIAQAAGGSHSLALCADGSLAAWGDNEFGALGNGTFTSSGVPVPVTITDTDLDGKTVAAIAAGAYHNLALCSDGTVVAWGDGFDGQLGNDESGNDYSLAWAVHTSGTPLDGKSVVAIAAGGFHSMALCSDGTLATWGYNGFASLGNNSTTSSTVPVAVNTDQGVSALHGKTVVAIAAGKYHSLALCSDGTLAAWGNNLNGELGNNSTANNVPVPVAVVTAGTPLAGKTIIAIAAGGFHSMALCSDGTVAAWGYNGSGELGNGTYTDAHVPVATTKAAFLGRTVTAISASLYDSMALCSDGTPFSWGDNQYGQLGNNSTGGSSALPVAVSTASLAPGETFAQTATADFSHHALGIINTSPSYPVATTLAATAVTTSSATLNATVNPAGNDTSANFQYGLTTSYGATTPDQDVGSGSSPVAVNASISGLSAHTTYHFVAVGSDDAGSAGGGDLSFTTLNNPPVANADTVNNVCGPVAISVLSNDTDVDGDTLAITGVTQGTFGAVATDGSIVTYTPGASFATSDTFTYSISDGFGGTAAGHVTVNAAPVQSWRVQVFGASSSNPAVSGDNADPNHNGISNLLEYALHGDPTGGSTGTSVLPQVSRSATGCLQITFTRYLDRNDITLVVQVSDTLNGTWTSLAQSVNGAAFTILATGATANETGSGNARSMTVGDLYQMTDPTHPHRFMRLEVTRP